MNMRIKCFIFNLLTIFPLNKKLESFCKIKNNELVNICKNDNDCGNDLYCCDYIVYKSCCKGGVNNYYDHPLKKIPIKVKIE